MARPVKARESFEREIGQLSRIRRVVELDAKPRSKLWHREVLGQLNDLLTHFMREDTRRRLAR
jgi:hypothetical protein